MENSIIKKSCIRKLLIWDGEETTDANVILKEIYDFYSHLYDKKLGIPSDFSGCPFVENSSTVPKLNDAMREMCEGQLTVSECFQVLLTFQNNKAPGNDGLSPEFYKLFLARNRLLASRIINYFYAHGELSTPQNEAIITLIEKKDSERRLIKN